MVHANGRIPVQQALEAGCHSIEHGYFMGEENLRFMAEKQAVLVPTLYAMKACAEMADSADERKVAEKNLARQLEQVAYAREIRGKGRSRTLTREVPASYTEKPWLKS